MRAAGHDVYTPTLTGLGERAHLATRETGLDTHIRDVLGVLEFEELNDVVLVGHSMAGRGYAETSQEHRLSSSNRLGCREGQVFGIGLAGLEAVVEAAEEAVEQVALCGGVPIACRAPPVVVSSGTG